MRDTFSEYYPLSKKEYKKMWDTGIFVLDTNVLLDLYELSNNTSIELLKIFSGLSDRLWIPYHVAWEYHNQRLMKINKLENSYKKMTEIIDSYSEAMSKQLKNFSKHPFLDSKKFIKEIENCFDGIKKDIEEKTKEFPNWFSEDEILDKITNIFKSSIGRKRSKDELDKIFKEGKERYDANIPPGYRDSKKNKTSSVSPSEIYDNNEYGDFIIWLEIMEKADEVKKPVIFVTQDKKEDWWLKIGGKTVGPRYELIREIRDKSGVQFYMYDIYNFQKYAKEYLKSNIKKETSEELKEFKNFSTENIIENLAKTVQNLNLPNLEPPKIDPSIYETFNRLNLNMSKVEPPKIDPSIYETFNRLNLNMSKVEPSKIDPNLWKIFKEINEKYNNAGAGLDEHNPEDIDDEDIEKE